MKAAIDDLVQNSLRTTPYRCRRERDLAGRSDPALPAETLRLTIRTRGQVSEDGPTNVFVDAGESHSSYSLGVVLVK
jgi:hypothetical protein